jgi:hypothetical protein
VLDENVANITEASVLIDKGTIVVANVLSCVSVSNPKQLLQDNVD